MLKDKLEQLNIKIDEIALQKRLEIEAEHLKRIKCTKTIRIFTTFSGSTLKINTRVLNDFTNEEKTSFWDMVRRVCVCFNANLEDGVKKDLEEYAKSENASTDELGSGEHKESEIKSTDNTEHKLEDNTKDKSEDEAQNKATINSNSDKKYDNGNSFIFEWTKSCNSDGFAVPLNDSYTSIQILIKLKNQRKIYKLSKGLRDLLKKYTDTKYNIMKDLYKYVNNKKLNDYATSNVMCDAELQEIFKVPSFNFNNIGTLLEPLLEPICYCLINLENNKNQVWDIELETDDLSQMPVLYPSNVLQMEKMIEDNRTLKKKISDRISVLEEFIEDPVLFINRKIALESDGIGTKTAFYDDLSVQTALYELIRKKE